MLYMYPLTSCTGPHHTQAPRRADAYIQIHLVFNIPIHVPPQVLLPLMFRRHTLRQDLALGYTVSGRNTMLWRILFPRCFPSSEEVVMSLHHPFVHLDPVCKSISEDVEDLESTHATQLSLPLCPTGSNHPSSIPYLVGGLDLSRDPNGAATALSAHPQS